MRFRAAEQLDNTENSTENILIPHSVQKFKNIKSQKKMIIITISEKKSPRKSCNRECIHHNINYCTGKNSQFTIKINCELANICNLPQIGEI